MLERLAARLYAAATENPSLFRMRLFFVVVLWGFAGGLAIAATFFVGLGLSFQEDLLLFIIPFVLFVLFSVLSHHFILRFFFRTRTREGIKHLHGARRFEGLLATLLRKKEFKDFEEALLREYEEARITLEEEHRHNLQVSAWFGSYIPDVQIEKVLEDERFFALLGVQRDALVIGVSLVDLPDALMRLDAAERKNVLKKLFSEFRKFARQQGLLVSDFHSSGTFCYHGLPYDAETLSVSKLITRAGKFHAALLRILSQFSVEVSPLCLIAHGTLEAGLVEVGDTSHYVITGELLLQMREAFKRLSGTAGLFVGESLDGDGEADSSAEEKWLLVE